MDNILKYEVKGKANLVSENLTFATFRLNRFFSRVFDGRL